VSPVSVAQFVRLSRHAPPSVSVFVNRTSYLKTSFIRFAQRSISPIYGALHSYTETIRRLGGTDRNRPFWPVGGAIRNGIKVTDLRDSEKSNSTYIRPLGVYGTSGGGVFYFTRKHGTIYTGTRTGNRPRGFPYAFFLYTRDVRFWVRSKRFRAPVHARVFYFLALFRRLF